MVSFNNWVGVIDSGVGGLTILKQLQRDFPSCNFLYLADSAYCPYGTKLPSQILQRVQLLIQFMQGCSAQALVIACNTASVYADTLRQQFGMPIYDVIAPTCERVTQVTKSKRVALLATNATVASRAYQRKLKESGVATVAFPCSTFVPFVETNRGDTDECSEAVNKALANLAKCNVDAVILGCTHFPLLRKKIAPFTCGAEIVECCTHFQPTCFCNGETVGQTVFLTTGEEKQANHAAQWYGEVHFVHVDI